jgi:hypothetical protein
MWIVFFVAALLGFGWSTNAGTQTTTTMPVSAMLLLPPGLFLVTNVVLSWRIDTRIITTTYRHGLSAAHDAFSLIAATVLFSLFFRSMAHFVFKMPWASLPTVWVIWPVLGVTALVIGFAIPGWAVWYIYPPKVDPNIGSARQRALEDVPLTHGTKVRA